MNVGILLPGFSASEDDWAIPVQQTLVREMSKRIDLRVIATRYPHTKMPYSIYDATVYPLGAGAWARKWARLRLWWDTLRLIEKLHTQRPFDVLHAMWADETGLLATWAGKRLNIPVVVSIAGGELVGFEDINYGLQRSRFSRWTVRQALEGASTVIVACDYVHDLLEYHALDIIPEKIHKISLGVDTNLFTPSPTTAHAKHLIHVASLIGVKDQITLLRAFAKLDDDTTLTIIGEGKDQPILERLTRTLGIMPRVTFVGSVPHLALPSYYQRAQINLLTSRHEGLGMVTLEAGACAVPTISTRVGLVPDEPALGLTVPIGDTESLAQTIRDLLNNPVHLRTLSHSAHTSVNTKFTIQHAVNAFLAQYDGLIR